MTNWGAAVPIIVAIIGILGTSIIVPTFSGLFPLQLYNKPNLKIDIHPARFNSTTLQFYSATNNTIINLRNIGTMPATNLSLILTPEEGNETIDFITNEFSTVNVTLVSPRNSLLEISSPVLINQSFLELHVKKFINGDGSLIRLAINGTTPFPFVAYATYDQGSMKAIDGLSSFFPSPESIVWYSVGVAISMLTYIIVIAYLIIFLKKRRKRTFLSKIQEQMMEVRKKLKENLSNYETFPFTSLKQRIPFYKRFNKTFMWQEKNLMWQKKSHINVKSLTMLKITYASMIFTQSYVNVMII